MAEIIPNSTICRLFFKGALTCALAMILSSCGGSKISTSCQDPSAPDCQLLLEAAGAAPELQAATSTEQTASAPGNALPDQLSNLSLFTIDMSTLGIRGYQYKFGPEAAVSCSVAEGYSERISVTTQLSMDVSGTSDGMMALCVLKMDVEGNWQAPETVVPLTWNKDTTSPTLSSVSISTTSPGKSFVPNVAFTLSEAATVTLHNSSSCSTLISEAIAMPIGGQSMATNPLTANSTTTIYATARDPAANTSACTLIGNYINDVTPPLISAPSVSTASPGTSLVPSVAFTLSETATVTLYDSSSCSAAISGAIATADGARSMTTNSLTADTTTTIYAMAIDATTNVSNCTSIGPYVNDTIAPAAPSITSVAGDTGVGGTIYTSVVMPAIAGTAEANSTVTVYDASSVLGTATSNASGAWLFTASLAAGSHTFTASATDAALNKGASSASVPVTIDTTAPAAPAIIGIAGDTNTGSPIYTNELRPAIVGTAENNSTVNVYNGNSILGTTMADGSGGWNYAPPSDLATGT